MIKRFGQARRSAVAIMFALCLLPLVLLVGLAIDTAFYSQARTQYGLAAEAAATHAVRVASAAYTLDISNHETQSAAATDGQNQGDAAGAQWFSAQLGPLLRASTQSVQVNVYSSTLTNNGICVQPGATTAGGAGFCGTVTYALNYPPIFNALFGASSSNTWSATASSTAQTSYQYVEVLLMIDTSNSMLIGADQSDIDTLAENSVCPQTGTTTSTQWLTSAEGINPTYYSGIGYIYDSNPLDNDSVDFTKVAFYNNPTGVSTDDTGSCQTKTQSSNGINHQPTNITVGGSTSSGAPLDACALACHTVTTTASDGYFQDLYGMARRNKVNLRLDVVLTATENVIQDLYNAEQSANQFTVGIYQFNGDVSPMVNGNTSGTPPGGSVEATADLEGDSTSALSTIEQKYDYNTSTTPNSVLLPLLIEPSNFTINSTGSNSPGVPYALDDGDTNFTKSAVDLLAGNATGGTAIQGVPSGTTVGATSSYPERNLFIITDGFEDEGPSNGSGNGTRYMGEMTSYKNEEAGLSTATCQQFKAKGFNVYVLYVVYDPIPHLTYYDPGISSYYSQTDATDFSQLAFNAHSAENVLSGAPSGLSTAEVAGSNPDTATNVGSGEVGPDVEALEACATKGDFYEASSSSDIQTAMTAMLQSAISSAITVTK